MAELTERERRHADRHRTAIRALLRGEPRPVADFGCGHGIFADTSEAFVGLDRSLDSLREVRKLGRAAVSSDIEVTPLRDGSCGGVLCINTLHLVAHPERVLREMDRVLGPGGIAYVSTDFNKSGGRGRAGDQLSRLARRLSFLLHPLLHPRDGLRVMRRSRGDASMCPYCFRGFFRQRGYAVESGERKVTVLRKPGQRPLAAASSAARAAGLGS